MLVSDILVYDNGGIIDVQATLDKFKPLLEKAREVQITSKDEVSTAVNAVFDAWKGQRIPINQLVSHVIGKMNCPPDACKKVGADVRAFIEAHPDLYNTKGGKGGGVGRLCDIPIKALPAAKAKRSSKKSTAKADEAPAS